jgi:hypothetical protein
MSTSINITAAVNRLAEGNGCGAQDVMEIKARSISIGGIAVTSGEEGVVY